VNIYIEEINISLWWKYYTFILMTFTIIWNILPMRKSCNRDIFEICFNLFPAEIFLFLIFAQWYFIIAIIIAATVILLNIIFCIKLNLDTAKKESDNDFSDKEFRRYKKAKQRFFVVSTSIFLVIPCCLSIFLFKLKPPQYKAEQELKIELLQKVTLEINKNDLLEENKELLQSFRKDIWENYSVQEKLSVIQVFAEVETKRLGIPYIPIETEWFVSILLGRYSNENNNIIINLEYLDKSTPEDCLSTCIHEIYHGYQYYLINNTDWESGISQSILFDEVRQWRENSKDYKQASIENNEYEEQPLEKSARAYAKKEYDLIMSYIK